MDVKEAESILFRAWDCVCAREQKLGFGNLRRAEQVFVSIWMLEAEVNNGGGRSRERRLATTASRRQLGRI